MDMTDKEFHRLFLRAIRTVSFEGCNTPAEVNERLMRRARQLKYVSNSNPLTRLHAENEAEKIQRLVPYFGERVIGEAHAKPHGLVAQYLRYGRKKAEAQFKKFREWGLNRKYRRKRRR